MFVSETINKNYTETIKFKNLQNFMQSKKIMFCIFYNFYTKSKKTF